MADNHRRAARSWVRAHLDLVRHLFRLNLQGALEYRVSFLLQVVFMGLNNLVFLGFWWLFFQRFDHVDGWKIDTVLLVFSVTATAFGICHVLLGNLPLLAVSIEEGRLDQTLGQPKDPLLKILAARTSTAALGDLVFGVALFLTGTPHGFGALPLFFVVTSFSAVAFASFGVLTHSLAFWMGRATGVAGILGEAILTFSLYPEELFTGGVRFLLYTLVPAAMVAYLPVRILNAPTGELLAGYALACLAFAGLACGVFRAGLRRYSSGNQMVTNV